MIHSNNTTNKKNLKLIAKLLIIIIAMKIPLFSQTINHKFNISENKYIYYFEDKNLKLKSKYYDTVRPFKEGRALVGHRLKKNGYKLFWNILNKKYKEVLPIDSSRVLWTDFFEGYAFVDSKITYGFIDKNGKYYPNNYSLGTIFEGGIAKTYVDKTVGGMIYLCKG